MMCRCLSVCLDTSHRHADETSTLTTPVPAAAREMGRRGAHRHARGRGVRARPGTLGLRHRPPPLDPHQRRREVRADVPARRRRRHDRHGGRHPPVRLPQPRRRARVAAGVLRERRSELHLHRRPRLQPPDRLQQPDPPSHRRPRDERKRLRFRPDRAGASDRFLDRRARRGHPRPELLPVRHGRDARDGQRRAEERDRRFTAASRPARPAATAAGARRSRPAGSFRRECSFSDPSSRPVSPGRTSTIPSTPTPPREESRTVSTSKRCTEASSPRATPGSS